MAAVDGPGRALSRRTARLFGAYNGNTTVRFRYEGERRRTQSGVEVFIDEPIEDDGIVEDNPFSLGLVTRPSIADAGGAYEGMYSAVSAATYLCGASAPAIDYRPRDTWLAQHWDLRFTDGRLTGSMTDTNSALPNAL